jgi:integrase
VRFLRSAGVGTQEEAEGYSRAVNRKGSHSLRHTFCSLAGMNGIPQSVVQSMVGHLTPRMAELYSRHVTDAAKAAYMERYGRQVAQLSGLPRLGAG